MSRKKHYRFYGNQGTGAVKNIKHSPKCKNTPILDTEECSNFRTSEATATYAVTFNPVIVITPIAIQKMQYLVGIARKEVGWFGTVQQIESKFIIDDIFLPEQNVSGAETDTTSGGLVAIDKYLRNSMPTQKEGRERAAQLRFWGHSHVRMGVSPSGQDNTQMKEFGKGTHGPKYMIRGIFNKLGAACFTMYHYERGIIIDKVPWSVEMPMLSKEAKDELKEEFLEKVNEQVTTFYSKSSNTPKQATTSSTLVDISKIGAKPRDADDARAYRLLLLDDIEIYPRNSYEIERPAIIYNNVTEKYMAHYTKESLERVINARTLNGIEDLSIFLPPIKTKEKDGEKEIIFEHGDSHKNYETAITLWRGQKESI